MKTNKLQSSILLLAFLSLLGTSLWFLPSREAGAVAPGCTSGKPTAITGSISAFGGEYHGWSVNVMVGYDLINSAGKKVKADGTLIKDGSYSYTDSVNGSLDPPGASSGHDRTFGAKESHGNGPLCVHKSITSVWFELYPKNTSGSTQKIYFGGASDQKMKVKPGATNTYSLRIPTARAYGGNTGDVNGYVTYKGHSVNPSNLTFRAFPLQTGSACGVQGFSAAADGVGVSASAGATYYLIKNLAGGQCNATKQPYKIIATCKSACGSGSRSITKNVNVAGGARPRIDFKF